MIESARRRAQQANEPQLGPPHALEQCNRATVELALGKPQAGFAGVDVYPDLAAKTAALLYGLSKSQACSDGNKRIALLLAVAFIRLNGANLNAQPDELSNEILRIAESDMADHDDVIASARTWVAERLTEGSA